MAQMPEYYSDDYQIPTANLKGPDPRYQKSVLEGQKNLASQFRANLPQYQDSLGNQYEKSAKQDLAQNMKNVRKDFNSRGLLRSGGRAGAEAKATAGSNFDIAQGRYGINQSLADQADSLENNYVNSAYGLAGVSPQIGSGLLQNTQNTINNEISRNQALNDIFGGAGKGLGYIFSKLNNKD